MAIRSNRDILSRGDNIYARKKQKHGVEEIKFDQDARKYEKFVVQILMTKFY